MEKIVSLLRGLLSFALPRAEIVRARPVTDAQLIASMAVDSNHPMFQAFLELIDRGRNEARIQAKNVIKNDRETVFALGQEYGLDQLEEYLLNLRAEGLRQLRKEQEMTPSRG